MISAVKKAAKDDFSVQLDRSEKKDELDKLESAIQKLLHITQVLRQSEEKYRNILETMNEGLFENDLEGNFTYVNSPGCRMVGYEREELIGRNFRDVSSPELANYLYEAFHQVYKTGNPEILVDYEITRKDGSKRIHQSHPSLIRDLSGKPIGFRNLVRDVTDRKNVEDALRKSEEKYRTILETMEEGLIETDLQGNATYVNNAACRLHGFKREEMIGANFKKHHTPEMAERVYQIFNRIYNTGEPELMEIEIIRKDGSVRTHQSTGSLMCDSSGRPHGFRNIIRDVTELKRAEEERLMLEAQLLQAQKMESVGRLAGGVAHDFNNMLNVILGYAELIKIQMPDGDPLLKDVSEIERAAYRSRDITRQLLAFSRKQIIAPRPVDLNDLIEDLQNSLVRLIGEDIDLRFCPGEKLWRIQFDPSQMEQIILNLGVNARDAMPVGGKLTIETENVQLNETYCREHLGFMPGQYVLLGVSDDGVGMDKETLSHAFEPFFTTKETGKGTGLGLATVYGIVKQNNGFVNVYSEPGRGTSFKIYFPRSLEEGEILEEVRDETVISGAGHILLVEDDEMVRTMTTEMLEALGYTVTATGNPHEAMSICQNSDTPVDLVITDVVMPGMSGTDLRDKMLAVRPELKVLFMSGYTSNVIVHRGVLEENVHFIEKPFSMIDFARKVNETIKNK
jgi:PAS domain S-box-containing protein